MTKLNDLIPELNKTYGDKTARNGDEIADLVRLPTGIFSIDYALGGGIPIGKVTMVGGYESTGKTNLTLKTIASFQKLYPDYRCIMLDVEHSYNRDWAEKLGVDTQALLHIKPENGEQVVDIVEAVLNTEDCGLVVIDSLGAMTQQVSIDKATEDKVMADIAALTAKLVKKTTVALGKAEKEGRPTTLFYVTQVYQKIGVMFGDPTVLSGGNKPKFQCSCIIKMGNSKPIIDSSIDPENPIRKASKFKVEKFKFPIISSQGEYEMVTMDYDNYVVGDVEDWKEVKKICEAHEFLTKEGKGYSFMGQEYKTLKEIKEQYTNDSEFKSSVNYTLIEAIKEAKHGSKPVLKEE